MIFSKAKNLLLASVIGLAGGLVSCVDESYDPQPVNLEKEFLLTVDAPEGFRSRAAQHYGDGALNELHLRYAIFGNGGEIIYSSDDAKAPKATSVDNGQWQLKLRLAEGIDYQAFFWADQFGVAPTNPYTVDLKKAWVDVDYNKAFTAENLKTDRCDAYGVYKEFTAGPGLSFTMKRPFCQVNIGSPEPSVVDRSSAYHDNYVTVSFDDNKLVSGYGFADGKCNLLDMELPAGGNAYPSLWPAMKISDFDNTGFEFPDNEDAQEVSKYMYMAYLLTTGKEERLNIHIEGLDNSDHYAYHPEVRDMIGANNRLIVVPKWQDGGDGFIDPRDRKLTFLIGYDPGFDGTRYAVEEVKVDVYHTLSWSLGSGVKSVTINGKSYTANGSIELLEGTKVNWAVTPSDGYAVDGAESGFITMTSNQNLDFTATWIDVYYTLRWYLGVGVESITINGTRYTSSGNEKFVEGTKISWSATPSDGYDLNGLSTGSFFMSANRWLDVTANPIPGGEYDYTFSWNGDEGVQSVIVNSTTYGASGSISVGDGGYVSWSAVIKPGYHEVSGGSGSVTMTGSYNVSIRTAPDTPTPTTYTFSWDGDSGVQGVTVNGSSYGASGSITVNEGDVVSWSAAAKSGYHVVSGAPGSVTIHGDESTYIETAPDAGPTPPPTPETVTFSWDSDAGVQSVTVNGVSKGVSGSVNVTKGSTVSWSASAKPGYHIKSGAPGSMVMNADDGTYIETEKDPDLSYTFSWDGDAGVQSVTVNGTTYGASGSITVKKGTTVSWSASAKTGYEFVGSSSGSTTINGNDGVSFSTRPIQCSFSWSIDEGIASITVNGTTYTSDGEISVSYGTTVSWSASAKDGYDVMPPSSGSTIVKGSASCSVSSKKKVEYCTIICSGDAGVKTIKINGRPVSTAVVEVGTFVTVEATALPGYIFTSYDHDTFEVLPGSGTINIYFTTQMN